MLTVETGLTVFYVLLMIWAVSMLQGTSNLFTLARWLYMLGAMGGIFELAVSYVQSLN